MCQRKKREAWPATCCRALAHASYCGSGLAADHGRLGMVPDLFMFASASVGFGGHPWIAFAGGAFLMIVSSAPETLSGRGSLPCHGVCILAPRKSAAHDCNKG